MNIDRQRLYDGSKELVERLADRLPEADVETFLSLHDVGEPLYLLNLLCAGLIKWRTEVTAAERDALAELVTGVASTNTRYPFLVDAQGSLEALNVVE
ncbi:hypothetical protein BLA60_37590 [Actinophytocola xinjiangensis]|uniref:Uncharacterized protein n=1 Tax=Actinophytocola xinjiangensis TaxID=485602 RepID=A0A7Z0WE11_9PSEU|nr:hypothetical protein [Actinophytocola xinjiangensis]OLF05096.1 hypothetical protein BLA60_37590 [Actinophytocola xinjiangensis]